MLLLFTVRETVHVANVVEFVKSIRPSDVGPPCSSSYVSTAGPVIRRFPGACSPSLQWNYLLQYMDNKCKPPVSFTD